jgi:hypothetical protein
MTMGGGRQNRARLPTVVIIGSESARAGVLRKLGRESRLHVVWCERTEDVPAVLAKAESLIGSDATKRVVNADCEPTHPIAVRAQRGIRNGSVRRKTETIGLGLAHLDTTIGELIGPSGCQRLTSTELRLARYLHGADGPRPAKRIARELFERTDVSGENLVHKHVGNLRAKLAQVGATPQPIERLALGYSLVVTN